MRRWVIPIVWLLMCPILLGAFIPMFTFYWMGMDPEHDGQTGGLLYLIYTALWCAVDYYFKPLER